MGSRYTGDFVKPGGKPVGSKYVGYGNEASKSQGKAGKGDKADKSDKGGKKGGC